jgi:WD40 repeat protein
MTKLVEMHPHRFRFSLDGKRVAAVGVGQFPSGLVQVLDAENGKELQALDTAGLILGLAIHPDGKRLATGSMDGSVKIWDLATRQEILVLKAHTDFVTDLCFTSTGQRLISAAMDRTVRVWDATPLPDEPPQP